MFRVLQTASIFVALAIVAIVYIHAKQPIANFPDFAVFYAGGAIGPIYNPAWLKGIIPGAPLVMPFVYPPTFVMICRVLRAMPYDVAYSFWSAASGTLFLEAARRMAPRVWWLAVLAPACTIAFREGQTSFLIGGLTTLAFTLSDRPWRAGAIYGLAFALKPQVLLLLPLLLLLERSWATLVALGVTGLMICFASLALGPSLWGVWTSILLGHYKVTAALNLDQLGADGPWWWAAVVLALCGLIASLWSSPPVRLSATIGGSLLVSPHAMFYEQAMLVPAALGLLWPLNSSTFAGLIVMVGRVTGPGALALTLALNAVMPPVQRLLAARRTAQT